MTVRPAKSRVLGTRLDGPQLEVYLSLRGAIAAALISAALARGCRPVDLLADVIEHVCGEDLFAAVVDL